MPPIRMATEWKVTGEVRNVGTGETIVPVALRTSQGSQWRSLRVDGGASVPFVFSTSGNPYSVQLDPDHVCYRRATFGLTQNVEFRGEP